MVMVNPEPFKEKPHNVEEAIGLVVLANRILANENVVDTYGHVSLRNPENSKTFLQSRSLSPEFVTQEDILEIELDGGVLTKTEWKPYRERIIHGALLKARPEINAVFHGHPAEVVPFSCTETPIRPVSLYGSLFYEGVPVYHDYDVSDGMMISSQEEGERIGRVLGKSRAMLLSGHGCIVVGESIQAMVAATIYFRDHAAVQLNALQLGQPKYLSLELARQASRVLLSAYNIERSWAYWVERAKKSMADLR